MYLHVVNEEYVISPKGHLMEVFLVESSCKEKNYLLYGLKMLTKEYLIETIMESILLSIHVTVI